MLSSFGGISFFSSRKNRIPFETITPPEYVYIKIPAGYEKIVSLGDSVLYGQPLATKENSVSILASVSGTVETIYDEIIIIKNDFCEKSVTPMSFDKSLTDLSDKEISDISNTLGIYDGDISLSEKIKYSTGKIENVILSCIDTEPTCATSEEMLFENASSIIGGLKILIHAVKARLGIIAISTDNEKLLNHIENSIDDASLIISRNVENKYPIENEKCLIYALKRKEISSKSIIEDGKCLVIKAETAKCLFDGMASGIPTLDTIITASGKGKSKKNLLVPIGCKVSHILNFCEYSGLDKNKHSIISGGLMCGQEIFEDDIVDFATKSITVIKKRHYTEKNCIRCGKCIDVCPMLLKPLFLYSNALNDKNEENLSLGITQCIGCGCCSYVCPSKIPLSNIIYQSKSN